ncbi:MAG: signal recognition particle-docking protein FtsY [Alphaproteobacteria bacterium]|nr:signal recognition particle-docking protein FtsY [Alphaproteobacteria bacterium]USO08644.1 MAG: signal recognition particle-docking protein FtsY [Rhodospirillales bacterium]
MHHKNDPALEPSIEYDADVDDDTRHRLEGNETEIVEGLNVAPVPRHTPTDDALEAEDLKDHTNEGGWLSRLSSGLSRSTARLTQGLGDLFTKSHLDPKDLRGLEDVLIAGDLGPQTASRIVKSFSAYKFERDADAGADAVRTVLAREIEAILAPVAKPLAVQKPEKGPFVLLVTGVNGVGKTTTIGKLGYALQRQGHRVMLAAADTFRAAAVEQIQIWGKRLHAPVVSKDIGADAAAVAFEAYEKAKAEGYDVLIVDTAGRLHNKGDLMAELGKIVRVLGKTDETAPHATLLVLDATTGQNAFAQVEAFRDVAKITGLVVTKLDGSAKGGVVVGLADKFGLPVHAVGVGEGVEDLQPFTARDYARSLVGLN